MRTNGKPVLSFRTPPNPPANVAAVAATFDDVADRYAILEGKLQDGLEEVEAAKTADAERNAAAFMEGKPTPKVLDRDEKEALAKVAGLRAALNAAAAAVDNAGNKLLRSIPAAKAQWLADLEDQKAEVTKRYLAAVEEAQAAVAELAPLHGAIAWLQEFEPGQVLAGRGREWHGRGRLRVDGEGFGAFRDEQDPAELLRFAAKVGQPRAKQTGIVHGPAKITGQS